jgi:hypothetical protein
MAILAIGDCSVCSVKNAGLTRRASLPRQWTLVNLEVGQSSMLPCSRCKCVVECSCDLRWNIRSGFPSPGVVGAGWHKCLAMSCSRITSSTPGSLSRYFHEGKART